MSEPDHIAIFAAADENYVKPMATMMASVLINHKGEMPIKFYLSGAGICDENKALIEALAASHSASVEWVEINNTDAENFRASAVRLRASAIFETKASHFSDHACDRLLMPGLLPEELSRAIYLDVDLVVLGDIEELWNLPVSDYPVLATQEYIVPTISDPYVVNLFKDLDLDPDTKYFNSGVMLVNLDYWREQDTTEQLLVYLADHVERLIFWDQDVLNAVLANQWGELAPQWNAVTHVHEAGEWRESESPYTEEAFNAALKNPNIVHFCTPRKPWKPEYNHPAKALYFEYLDKTPWKGWRPELT